MLAKLSSQTLSEIATSLRRLGQNNEAIMLFKEAVECLESTSSMGVTEALIRNNYGECARAQQHYTKAIDILEAARNFEPDFSEEELIAKILILTNLSNAYFENDNPDAARNCINEIFGITDNQTDGFRHHIASVYNTLANLENSNGNIQSAEDNFRKALRSWNDKIDNHVVGSAITYQNYAFMLMEKHPLKALTHFRRVRVLLEQYYRTPHAELAEVLFNISLLENSQGKKDAIKHAKIAVEVYSNCYVIDEDTLSKYQINAKNMLTNHR